MFFFVNENDQILSVLLKMYLKNSLDKFFLEEKKPKSTYKATVNKELNHSSDRS